MIGRSIVPLPRYRPDTTARYSFFHPSGKPCGSIAIERAENYPGRIPIQSAHTAHDALAPLLLKIGGHRICERIALMVMGWVHGEAGGLIEDQQIIVLIADIERELKRLYAV